MTVPSSDCKASRRFFSTAAAPSISARASPRSACSERSTACICAEALATAPWLWSKSDRGMEKPRNADVPFTSRVTCVPPLNAGTGSRSRRARKRPPGRRPAAGEAPRATVGAVGRCSRASRRRSRHPRRRACRQRAETIRQSQQRRQLSRDIFNVCRRVHGLHPQRIRFCFDAEHMVLALIACRRASPHELCDAFKIR